MRVIERRTKRFLNSELNVEIQRILAGLQGLYDHFRNDDGTVQLRVVDDIVPRLLEERPSARQALDAIEVHVATLSEQERGAERQPATLDVISVNVIAILIGAAAHASTGRLDLAWYWMAKADYWFGVCVGMGNTLLASEQEPGEALAALSRVAHDTRYAPSRAAKEQAIAWARAEASRYTSLNQLAVHMSEGQFRDTTLHTLRRWLTTANKEQPLPLRRRQRH